jgi:hypothetical protein
MKIPDCLKPGDCLLYRPNSIVGWFIAVKTWRRVSHCEVYVGGGMSVAARGPQDGVGGVGLYALRLADLAHVLRPSDVFRLGDAMQWFGTVAGEKYDFWGLLRFFTIGTGWPDRMFCSEFATRFYRRGGLEPFQPDVDADTVAPGELLLSPVFTHYVVHGELLAPAHLLKETV